MKVPEPISRFSACLRETIPESSVEIDRPRDPKGEWWLDIACADFRPHVAWRPAHGFGVFTSEGGYGDRPDEVYRLPELAAMRIGQLLRHWKASSRLRPLSLPDIRQLRGKRQTALAETLEIDQGAVSRLERREDLKLSSLQSYFRAMGGRLEMRVHFDSFDAAFSVSTDEGAGIDDETS